MSKKQRKAIKRQERAIHRQIEIILRRYLATNHNAPTDQADLAALAERLEALDALRVRLLP